MIAMPTVARLHRDHAGFEIYVTAERVTNRLFVARSVCAERVDGMISLVGVDADVIHEHVGRKWRSAGW